MNPHGDRAVVHVLLAHPLPPGDVPAWLPDVERRRVVPLRHEADRRRRLTSAVLLHVLAAGLTGSDPGSAPVARLCPRCGTNTDHGRPVLAGRAEVFLSAAHSGDVVVAAAARDVRVGVDVEPVRSTEPPGLARIALHEEEIRRLDALSASDRGPWLVRQWTRKEALLKALGHGLALDPRSVGIAEDGRLTWSRPPPAAVGRVPAAVHQRNVEVGLRDPEYVASVLTLDTAVEPQVFVVHAGDLHDPSAAREPAPA